MDKMSIKWYQRCLVNSTAYYDRMKEEMGRRYKADFKRLSELAASNKLRAYQIECAIKEGKGGFDADRYKISKLKEQGEVDG